MPEEVAPAGQDNTATVQGTQPPASPANTAPPAPQPAPAVPPALAQPQPEAAPAKPAAFTSMLDPEPAKPIEASTEGKPADPSASASEADFDIAIPEGFEADAEAMTALKAIVKTEGLSAKDRAQQLADAHMASVKRLEEQRVAAGLKQIEAWEGEIKTHPDFGGARLDGNLEDAKRMLQRYGSPRLMKEFREMGVLSHPEFAFMLMRMSRDLSEGASIGGQNQARAEKSTADLLFPDLKK